ncbi:MAG: hypothetical protein J0I06_26155 [Planctomycetes bacterium]|nr:hypothetical protein [Planctomycetota bacterium]
MSLPATDPDAPPAVHAPRETIFTAAKWACVCGAYAGVLWAGCWWAACTALGTELPFGSTDRVWGVVVPLALLGGILGCLAGMAVGLFELFRRRSGWDLFALILGGALFGSFGCGASAFVAAAARGHLHPLLSSSLAMATAGFFAGMCGHRVSCRLTAAEREEQTQNRVPPVFAALGWALAGAVCAGGAWAGGCLVAQTALGVRLSLARLSFSNLLLLAALGTLFGGLAGVLVGLCGRSGARRQTALALGIWGATFGTLAGWLHMLALVTTGGDADSLFSSSLAMAAVGFLAGLCGYTFLHRPAGPDEPLCEEEPAVPDVKVEWLLREPKRRRRLPPPLVRVLPVLAVSVGVLLGAALASQAALLAVALLGFAVAWVLYRQERRLDTLERQPRG